MRSLLGVVATLAATAGSLAHEGPHRLIERLDADVQRQGANAGLQTRRGDELAVLGRSDQAIEAYESAIALQPNCLPAQMGLTQELLRRGRGHEAISIARLVTTDSMNHARAGAGYALLARAHESIGDTESAVEAWEKAIHSEQPEVNWLLSHGEALGRLERHEEALAALAIACQRNPSLVLKRAWIEASIDAGQTKPAVEWIDRRLQRSPRQPTWLILRARARRRVDKRGAIEDLRVALEILATRLAPHTPNPLVEQQHAEAAALLAAWQTEELSDP